MKLPVLNDDGSLDAPAPEASPYGREYWRSLEARLGTCSSDERGEFPPGAGLLDPLGRRELMKLLGASLALAGATACRPRENLLPYHETPPEVTPSRPLSFATASTVCGIATGLLVQSYDGRPIKVEGNPEHPTSLGATGPIEQAQVLELYDPHRARQFRGPRGPVTRAQLLGAMAQRASVHERDGGAGLRFLVGASSSPLHAELRERIRRRYPSARFYGFAPVFDDNRWEGARLAFGRPLDPVYDLSRARVILSLDDDFLEGLGRGLALSRAFADRRVPGPEMNRLYVIESALTVTGMMADHRLALPASRVERIATALARRLSSAPAGRGLAEVAQALPSPELTPLEERWVGALATDLARAAGSSVVMAGRRQPPRVHALVHAINSALGNVGATVRFIEPVLQDTALGAEPLRALVGEMNRGEVQTLVVTAWNPVYASFADLDFGAALGRVNTSVYASLFADETSARAGWMAPALHLLESWGDARAHDGTATTVQPLIDPLYGGLTETELLAAFAGSPQASPRALLRETWLARQPGAGELTFSRWLQRGVLPGTASPPVTAQLDSQRVAGAFREALASSPGSENAPERSYEVEFLHDYKLYDGRFANNTWLQELPDPITKLTWGNAALMSPATARELGVQARDVVELTHRGKTALAPVYVLPGHADGVVTLPLGYGRAAEGEPVARGVGFSAYALRFSDAPWFSRGLSMRRTGRVQALAVTQEHWSMQGRPLAIDQTLEELRERPEELDALRGPVSTLHEPVSYQDEPYKWAMAVDLSRCTGCSACVVACQAENNIPVVGREGVLKSREMHWLRIDRYFEGPIESPRAITQPVACVHCETAPCEYVCPVNATVHSDEGLNEMVYNRCIGTRYCSNNCPYKVRRFNYLHWNAGVSATERMRMNPDVTVRARGVMEKCTYCVQRIERARIEARREGRQIRDGELQTACQQACPTQAIVFGSLNDPDSKVSALHRDRRRYDLLHDLGTRPRTAYLTRIRNLNPELT